MPTDAPRFFSSHCPHCHATLPCVSAATETDSEHARYQSAQDAYRDALRRRVLVRA